MRMVFHLDGLDLGRAELERAFAAQVAEPFAMEWSIAYAADRKRVAILVSREDHCLLDLLWRWRSGELDADVGLVLSNHRDVEERRRALRRPVRARAGHAGDEAAGRGGDAGAARRAASTWSCSRATCRSSAATSSPRSARRSINIHHSFLPAFAGADPYRRASERGVKIIGATAHYVTEELDAGPIIEQDVVRVSHRDDARRARAARPRRRAHGARARGPAPPRGPRARAREPHGRLLIGHD